VADLAEEIFKLEDGLNVLMNEIYDDAGQMVSFARAMFEGGDERLVEFEGVME
jgi:hypothetical protein